MGKVIATKRGNYWQYRFEGATVDGKRKWYSKSGFRTKAEALSAGAKAQSEYDETGHSFKPSEMSFADYLDYWIDTYCKTNLKDVTTEGYKKRIRLYIKPELGHYYLKSINPAVLQEFLDKKFNEGFSFNSLNAFKGILSGSLRYATDTCQFIKFNPASSIKLPIKRAKPDTPTRKKIKRPVTKEEWEKIIERFPEGEPSHIPLVLAYTCGLRLGEVFGLMWEDIDFEKSTLRVERQVQRTIGSENWYFAPPKFDSYRTISVDGNTMELLKREYEKQKRAKEYYEEHYTQLTVDKIEPSDHFFDFGTLCTHGTHSVHMIMQRENGTYIQPRIMQHVGRIIHGTYKEGYPVISAEWDFHSLRITHASMLLENEIPLPAIQERLGHAKIDVTQHYTKPTDKMRSDLLETLQDLY